MINSQRQKKQSSSALVILDEVIEPIIFFAEDDGFPYVFSDMRDITTSHFGLHAEQNLSRSKAFE